MHDLARPKLLAVRCSVPAACRSASRSTSFRPRPNKPRPPAQSISRRVQPLHSFLGDPRILSMESPQREIGPFGESIACLSYPDEVIASKQIPLADGNRLRPGNWEASEN